MAKRKVALNVPATNPNPKSDSASNPTKSDSSDTSRRYGTRNSNRDAHPGMPDKPQPRRSTQEVSKERKEKELAVAREAEDHGKAIRKVAELEDRYRQEDIDRMQDPQSPAYRTQSGPQKHSGKEPMDEDSDSISKYINLNQTREHSHKS